MPGHMVSKDERSNFDSQWRALKQTTSRWWRSLLRCRSQSIEILSRGNSGCPRYFDTSVWIKEQGMWPRGGPRSRAPLMLLLHSPPRWASQSPSSFWAKSTSSVLVPSWVKYSVPLFRKKLYTVKLTAVKFKELDGRFWGETWIGFVHRDSDNLNATWQEKVNTVTRDAWRSKDHRFFDRDTDPGPSPYVCRFRDFGDPTTNTLFWPWLGLRISICFSIAAVRIPEPDLPPWQPSFERNRNLSRCW